MNEDQTFSPEYNIGNQTKSESHQEMTESESNTESRQTIDDIYYDISKPKRRIIKAKIIND